MKDSGRRWQVWNRSGERIAYTRHVCDAAVLVDALGAGSTIRSRFRRRMLTLWTEGVDGFAGASFDAVTERVHAAATAPMRRKPARRRRRRYGVQLTMFAVEPL